MAGGYLYKVVAGWGIWQLDCLSTRAPSPRPPPQSPVAPNNTRVTDSSHRSVFDLIMFQKVFNKLYIERQNCIEFGKP